VAVDWFDAGREFTQGALEVIGQAWADEAARVDEAWERFLAAGAVGEAKASELATQIWAQPE
jgi:hypothetical protein